MNTKKKSAVLRVVALLLVVAFICPVSASAVEPKASNYLSSYSAYVYPAGGGKVQIWTSVTGVNYMDDIGAMRIQLFESVDNSTWTRVKTYSHDVYTSMLGHNTYHYSNYVSYSGIAGRYYKAYVSIWAGKDGGGDARYFWTSAKKAS